MVSALETTGALLAPAFAVIRVFASGIAFMLTLFPAPPSPAATSSATPGDGAGYEFVLPFPAGGVPASPGSADVVGGAPDGTSGSSGSLVPIGSVVLPDCSPSNDGEWAAATATFRLYGIYGTFPRYRVYARALTPPDPDPARLSTTDIGMGVVEVFGARPEINPLFDYDPRVSRKNEDGEPMFAGTVGSLPVGGTPLELFRTEDTFVGQQNTFTLVFAVGPQFFTPSPASTVIIQLFVEIL